MGCTFRCISCECNNILYIICGHQHLSLSPTPITLPCSHCVCGIKTIEIIDRVHPVFMMSPENIWKFQKIWHVRTGPGPFSKWKCVLRMGLSKRLACFRCYCCIFLFFCGQSTNPSGYNLGCHINHSIQSLS